MPRKTLWLDEASEARMRALAERWGLVNHMGTPNLSATVQRALLEAAQDSKDGKK